MSADMSAISRAFDIRGRLDEVVPFGTGHINDTYAATYADGGTRVRYVHQRINDQVFTDPPAVMANIQRVTEHLRRKLAEAHGDHVRMRSLSVVPTRDGDVVLCTPGGEYWRTYPLIEGTRTYEFVDCADQAYQAARAFGQFQTLLADLPAPPLVETIRDFHNTPRRWESFEQACATATDERRDVARQQIDFAKEHRCLADALISLQRDGSVPERTTHNDTKLNNVLFDVAIGQAVCVVDLDTVMPGLSLYDFGDMVRTMTCTAAEDETDLTRVRLDPELFAAVARGYVESTHTMLNDVEFTYLVTAGKTIIFEQALRFLTDWLAGDVYYKVHQPQHNLLRSRSQFALLRSLIEQEATLRDRVSAVVERKKVSG